MKGNQKLTSRDKAEIVRWYKAGAGVRPLAIVFGVRRERIGQILRDHGIPRRPFRKPRFVEEPNAYPLL